MKNVSNILLQPFKKVPHCMYLGLHSKGVCQKLPYCSLILLIIKQEMTSDIRKFKVDDLTLQSIFLCWPSQGEHVCDPIYCLYFSQHTCISFRWLRKSEIYFLTCFVKQLITSFEVSTQLNVFVIIIYPSTLKLINLKFVGHITGNNINMSTTHFLGVCQHTGQQLFLFAHSD